jgi:Family of unknown function (DUF6328)
MFRGAIGEAKDARLCLPAKEKDVAEPHGEEELRERLKELREDLRVALPGVQVLFAFLLTLPFSARFAVLNAGAERVSYLVAFLASMLSAIFLVTPSALHRVFHELDDPGGLRRLARVSAQTSVIGTVMLAVSMAAVAFMVMDVFYGRPAASVTAAIAVGLTAWFWFGLPLVWRQQG